MKIKCIMPDAVDFDLTYGKIYDVNRVDKRLAEDLYCVIDDFGDGSYMKEGEFEVVEESVKWSGECGLSIKFQKDKDIKELAQHINDFEEGFTISETLEEYLYNQGYRKTK